MSSSVIFDHVKRFETKRLGNHCLNCDQSEDWGEKQPFIYLLTHFYLAALGLSCSMWDLVFRPGIKPGLPALGVKSLSHWTTREVSIYFFNGVFSVFLVLPAPWQEQRPLQWKCGVLTTRTPRGFPEKPLFRLYFP